MNLTQTEKQILRSLVLAALKNGSKKFKYAYELWAKRKHSIASKPTIDNCLKKLQRRGLIEIKKEEKSVRRRKFYGLTFKGVMASLKFGLVNPEQAQLLVENSDINLFEGIEDKVSIISFDWSKLTEVESKAIEQVYSYLMKIMDLDFWEEPLVKFHLLLALLYFVHKKTSIELSPSILILGFGKKLEEEVKIPPPPPLSQEVKRRLQEAIKDM